MQGQISLTGIYIANMLGVILLLVLLIGNWRRIREMGFEYTWLLVAILCALGCCLIDPLIFTMDGKPGEGPRAVVLFGNTVLFAANLLTGFAWILFLGRHLNGGLKRWHTVLLNTVLDVGLATLLVNILYPVVFSVSEDNVYSRGPLYWLFIALDCLFLIDSVILYFVSKKRGGALKFFPIWTYIMPVIIGMCVQSLFYGISVVWPCVAISVAGILTSLQTESIFIDPLTGLFNRAYLDYIQRFLIRTKKENYSCIMLDLNGFKSINDRFGHASGDEAMREAGEILKAGVGSIGTVIRYAGDEFVAILNTGDEEKILACRKRIEDGFTAFNESKKRQYKLSASMGHGKLHLETESMNSFMNRIDKEMYASKRQYYLQHTEYDRRKR